MLFGICNAAWRRVSLRRWCAVARNAPAEKEIAPIGGMYTKKIRLPTLQSRERMLKLRRGIPLEDSVPFNHAPGTDRNGDFMEPYYAHSGMKKDLSDGEELRDHLRKVARRAKEFAQASRREDTALAAAAEAAGLLHDLGKYQKEWQQYLKDCVAGREPTSIPHAIHGAAYAAFQMDNLAIALVIAGHHAGLHDCDGLTGLAQNLLRDENRLKTILDRIMPEAQREFQKLPGGELPDPFDGSDEATQRRREFWTRVLFSVLVDADRLETERFYTGGRPDGLRLDKDDLANILLTKLHRAKQEKADKAKKEGKADSVLLDLRNRIYNECIAAGDQERGFFELTVPTGGGKTLSGMAFALAHAKKCELRRVIVVIPYLSIIEQNAREYKTIFGREMVIEHHSAIGEQEVSC
jgi:CRISPR-associated endonuclease/helicase Cas3